MTKSEPGRFTGQVALVTGANSGLGFAAASALARAGAKVLLAARRRSEGEQAAAAINDSGGEAVFVATDVTDAESVEATVAACLDTFGRLDIAFNNAGITGQVNADVADADIDIFDQVMAVNVRGVFLSMKYQVPAMLASGGGSIINCSSGAGLRGGPKASPYYASKHAVIGLTKSVALEYATHNIRVNAVCPGLILTDIVRYGFVDAPEKLARLSGRIPMERTGQPDEVAQVVLWLASTDSSFITGVAIPVDGGTTAG
jgi:NAD(P)-dependent dehydrogenase (short-subunit alcohol dehydrogenase family)